VRLKTTALALAAAAALVPLFGDPRVTPVTHPIWARMLLRALELNETVRASTQASEVFAALSWRDSLTFPADHYASADGVTVREREGVRCVVAGEGTGQVVYPLSVIGAGDYRMRVRLAGDAGHPATAEIAAVGQRAAPRTFTFVPPATTDWIRGEPAHLDPGSYTTTVMLPQGSALEYVEVAPPCVNPIEPLGGWQPAAPTTVEDLAVTMLKAIDAEDELAPADLPLERTGGDFQVDMPADHALEAGAGLEAYALKAEREGLEAVVSLDLPEPGRYTLSAYVVSGAGQRWLADGCRKAVLCPSDRAGWRVLMSQSFGAGRHTFRVAMVEGAVVERIRLERKKEGAGDYLAAIRRLGFDPGAEGAVSREKAVAAMRFVQDERRRRQREFCGDIELPQTVDAGVTVAAATPATSTGTEGPARPAIEPPAPIDIVLLPPQPPASPVTPLQTEAAQPSS
jgi:hypothetical protein